MCYEVFDNIVYRKDNHGIIRVVEDKGTTGELRVSKEVLYQMIDDLNGKTREIANLEFQLRMRDMSD